MKDRFKPEVYHQAFKSGFISGFILTLAGLVFIALVTFIIIAIS
ncbi:hypothetical protein ACH3O9_11220 [Leeuwenhoekiella sp. A16]